MNLTEAAILLALESGEACLATIADEVRRATGGVVKMHFGSTSPACDALLRARLVMRTKEPAAGYGSGRGRRRYWYSLTDDGRRAAELHRAVFAGLLRLGTRDRARAAADMARLLED